MERIVENAVKCMLCSDRIVSKHRHDMVRCTCGQVAVDGGTDYLRRVFSGDSWYDDSIIYPEGD